MHKMNEPLGMAISVVGALGVGLLVGEALFQYSVRDGVLVIKLFGLLPLRRIDLQRVKDISIIRLGDWTPFSDSAKSRYLWCERWGGYMLLFRGIALTLESGKTVLIAPRKKKKVAALIGAEVSRITRGPDPFDKPSDVG
jgi:hypothetical protein